MDVPGNYETDVSIGTAVARGDNDEHYGVVQMKLNELPYGCRPVESKTAGVAMVEAAVIANMQAAITRMLAQKDWPNEAIDSFLSHLDDWYRQVRDEEDGSDEGDEGSSDA
jgi:hypothetical protein